MVIGDEHAKRAVFAHCLLPCDRRRRRGTRITDPPDVVTTAGLSLSAPHSSPLFEHGKRPSCRNPSVIAIVAAIPTFKERRGGWIGIYTRTSAETRTASGTPDDSRPTRIISFSRKAKSHKQASPFVVNRTSRR